MMLQVKDVSNATDSEWACGAQLRRSHSRWGILGTVAVDITGLWLSNPAASYGLVFLAEAVLFVWAASLIFNIDKQVNADTKTRTLTIPLH